jgi:NTE family protein
MYISVLSGGGSKGAYGTGVLDYLINVMNFKYDAYVGVSTGSLMMCLAATGEIELLKEAYTSVTNKDIWKVNPFNDKGKHRIPLILFREFVQKKAWGDMGNLKNLIHTWFPKDKFNKVRENGITLIAVCSDFTGGKKRYFSNMTCDYDKFVDAILASCSFPVYTHPIIIDGEELLDGGVIEHVALDKAIEMGGTEIHCIIHRTKEFEATGWSGTGGLSYLKRTLDISNYEISTNDLNVDSKHKIKINYFYTPHNLTDNSLTFNKKEMLEWQNLGYATTKDIYSLKRDVIKKCFRSVNI